MRLHFEPLSNHVETTDYFFEDMERVWKSLGQLTELSPELMKKKTQMLEGKITGIVGFAEGRPMAIAWIDMPFGRYGNIVMHCIEPSDQTELAEAVVKQALFKGGVVELVQLTQDFVFRDTFIALGLFEKERQRMIYELPADMPIPMPEKNITYRHLSLENAEELAAVSFAAHGVRQHIEGYDDFASPEKRISMEKNIRGNLYGKSVDSASLLLDYQGRPAGICDVIEIECWGQPRVAWFMDVAVHPDFQGMGLARKMLTQSLYEIHKTGVSTVGLAVTLSNHPAVTLYTSMGFRQAEYFVEIIFPA